MIDLVKVFSSAFLLVTFMVFCIFSALRLVNKSQCETYGEVTGKTVKYEFVTCYVQDSSGKWYTFEELKNRMVATGDEK